MPRPLVCILFVLVVGAAAADFQVLLLRISLPDAVDCRGCVQFQRLNGANPEFLGKDGTLFKYLLLSVLVPAIATYHEGSATAVLPVTTQ